MSYGIAQEMIVNTLWQAIMEENIKSIYIYMYVYTHILIYMYI